MRNYRLACLITLLLSNTVGIAWGDPATPDEAPRVLGIGGVFFKVEDPTRINAWYRDHLGVDATEAGYTHFLWRNINDPERVDRTVRSTFPETSEHFGRAQQKVMVNYIVHDLQGLLAELQAKDVVQVGEVEVYDYGTFAWILDVEGNKVELWEPPESTPPGTTPPSPTSRDFLADPHPCL